jgi:hypothetical protein
LLKNTVRSAGLLAAEAADAAVDGLQFEAGVGVLDFGDEVAAGELCGAGAVVEAIHGVEDGGSAAWAGVGDLGMQGWDGDGGSVDGGVAVRIVCAT